jgi:hypothetical protein
LSLTQVPLAELSVAAQQAIKIGIARMSAAKWVAIPVPTETIPSVLNAKFLISIRYTDRNFAFKSTLELLDF